MRCSICKQPNHNSRGCHKNKRNDVPAPVQTESTTNKRKRKSPSKFNFEGNDLQSIRKSPRLKGKGKEIVIAGNEGVKAKLPVKRSLRLQGLVGEKPQALTQPVRPPGSNNMLDGVACLM
ncbi:chaperone protein HtpG, partial [Striga asiatica]